MAGFLEKILGETKRPEPGENEDFLELDWDSSSTGDRLTFKTLDIERYADVDRVVDALRDKRSIVLMRIKTRMSHDKTEVRRAIRRIQKSVYAFGGDIIGLSEEMILVTPPVVLIERDSDSAKKIEQVKSKIRSGS